MLDLAINYANVLKNKFRDTWFKEKYKFYNAATFCDDWNVCETTWTKHEFVSVRGNEVIGYICYDIDRANQDVAFGLCIINFEEKPSMTFAMDLGKALTDIFEKFCFRKLNFYIVVGNPIEKSYDKMCKKYGGRIVGVKKKNVRLFDGKLYDEKLYEIMREDYLNAKMQNMRKSVPGN